MCVIVMLLLHGWPLRAANVRGWTPGGRDGGRADVVEALHSIRACRSSERGNTPSGLFIVSVELTRFSSWDTCATSTSTTPHRVGGTPACFLVAFACGGRVCAPPLLTLVHLLGLASRSVLLAEGIACVADTKFVLVDKHVRWYFFSVQNKNCLVCSNQRCPKNPPPPSLAIFFSTPPGGVWMGSSTWLAGRTCVGSQTALLSL